MTNIETLYKGFQHKKLFDRKKPTQVLMKEIVPVPTEDQCYEIMNQFHMLDNVKRHSIQVMNVSTALVKKLKDPTIVQIDLVRAAALLHDIAKTKAIQTKELRHDLLGGQIMREMGYEAIAAVVESHVFFAGFMPDGDLEAREIVFYADKRVLHDSIVSVDERVDDLAKRYGINDHIVRLITENKKFVLQVESKIQRFLTASIEEIVSSL
jgi:uncharacterized protein